MIGHDSIERATVVAEAKTWLGTPFRDQADVKGGGVDCAMLLVRVFVDTGIVAPLDPRPYPTQWHLHQSEERFIKVIERFGAEVKSRSDPGRRGRVPVRALLCAWRHRHRRKPRGSCLLPQR
jgi:hypothetical protein